MTAAKLPDGDEFSRASVFGVFLTLGFCLLTQPFGSLFYVKRRRFAGRLFFYCWRLNPLACLAEALLILYLLVYGVYDALKKTSNPTATPLSLRTRLYLNATAILFVREQVPLPSKAFVLSKWTNADLIVNLVATTSVIVVAVKLYAVVIPFNIHLTAGCMIIGWALVQLLLLAASFEPELNAIDWAIMQRVHRAESRLRKPPVWVVLAVLSFIAIGFAVYACAYKATHLSAEIKRHLFAVCYIHSLQHFSGVVELIEKPVTFLVHRAGLLTWTTVLPRLFLSVLCVGFWASLYDSNAAIVEDCTSCPNCSTTCVLILFMVTCSLWVSLFLPVAINAKMLTASEVDHDFSHLWNIAMMGQIFTAAIAAYDPKSSYKPEWLDWLG